MPLSIALDRRRDAYLDHLLSVSTDGDWAGWLRFFLECVIEGADDALRLIGALEELRARWHAELQSGRSSALLLKLSDSLFGRPAISIGAASKLLGITPASASGTITKLENAGILREITGRTRDRVYIAPAILDIVNEPTVVPHSGDGTK